MASTGGTRRQLRYAEARDQVLAVARPLPPERVAVERALRRALRTPAIARHDLPRFRNSSMDGYAVRCAELATASRDWPRSLVVAGVVAAGMEAGTMPSDSVVMVMTGAPIPERADAIVPIEDALSHDTDPTCPEGFARFLAPPVLGANVREAGRDVRTGETVLEGGRELSPHDLALLVSLGMAEVEVGGVPRVAVFSTGDELVDAAAPLAPGSIRDSNLPMMRALLEEAGCQVIEAIRLPDRADVVALSIGSALDAADAVITLGGVSMGAFDPVRMSLERIGDVEWWRVAMKPGQPQAFGTPRGRLFFGLPGNPASVACVFEALVRPALRKLAGFSSLDRPRVPVRAAEAMESRVGRTDFVRVTLAHRDGAWWASPVGDQSSGHVKPQSWAHALAVISEGSAQLALGDETDALILRWPGAAGS